VKTWQWCKQVVLTSSTLYLNKFFPKKIRSCSSNGGGGGGGGNCSYVHTQANNITRRGSEQHTDRKNDNKQRAYEQKEHPSSYNRNFN
jgi:hypothetical protein